MGIKMSTPERVIRLGIKHSLEEGFSIIKNNLITLGDYCYQEAINRITYTHRTGNLGSSTGYICLDEGEVYASGGFFHISGPNRTDQDADGTEIGRAYAESLIPEFSKGYSMVFVAGMSYAGYVEAKGYNVITSAHIWAQQNALKIINSMNL